MLPCVPIVISLALCHTCRVNVHVIVCVRHVFSFVCVLTKAPYVLSVLVAFRACCFPCLLLSVLASFRVCCCQSVLAAVNPCLLLAFPASLFYVSCAKRSARRLYVFLQNPSVNLCLHRTFCQFDCTEPSVNPCLHRTFCQSVFAQNLLSIHQLLLLESQCWCVCNKGVGHRAVRW